MYHEQRCDALPHQPGRIARARAASSGVSRTRVGPQSPVSVVTGATCSTPASEGGGAETMTCEEWNSPT
jgi:hypothetical protein